MMYICAICSLGQPPLLPLAIEHRHLLEAIVSPFITTADISASYLFLCMDCQMKMLSIHHFQKMALNGVKNLKYMVWHMSFATSVQDNRKTNSSKQKNSAYKSPVIPHSAMEMINTEPDTIITTQLQPIQEFASVPAQRVSNPLTEEVHLKFEPELKCEVAVPQPYLEPDFELEWQPELEPAPQIEFKCKPEPQLESDFECNTKPQCHSQTTMSMDCESAEVEKVGPHIQNNSSFDIQYTLKPANTEQAGRAANTTIAEITKIEVEVVEKANAATYATTESDAATGAVAKQDKIKLKNRNRKKPQRVSCAHCNQILSDKWSLRDHYYRRHADLKPVNCNVCGKQYRNDEVLKIHMSTHKRENELKHEYFCEECSYRCSNKESYKVHLMSLKHMPREQYKFECGVCKIKYPKVSRLREHMDNIHRGLKNFKCKNCDEAFATRSSRSSHVRVVHEKHLRQKTFICDLCKKAFWIKKTLEDHLLAHQGLRPYKCKLCPADFSYSAALYTHNQLKHLKKKRKKKKQEKLVEDNEEQT